MWVYINEISNDIPSTVSAKYNGAWEVINPVLVENCEY